MEENPYYVLARMMQDRTPGTHILLARVISTSPLRLEAGGQPWEPDEIISAALLGWRPEGMAPMRVGAHVLCITEDYQTLYAICEVT